jgi:hypothetical protein
MELKNEQDRLKDIVEKFNDKLNAQLPHSASAMRDVPQPADCAVRIRGEESQLGEVVPRGFPEVLTTARHAEGEPEAERSRGTRRVDRQQGESSHRARHGEPHLAASLRRRHCGVVR